MPKVSDKEGLIRITGRDIGAIEFLPMHIEDVVILPIALPIAYAWLRAHRRTYPLISWSGAGGPCGVACPASRLHLTAVICGAHDAAFFGTAERAGWNYEIANGRLPSPDIFELGARCWPLPDNAN